MKHSYYAMHYVAGLNSMLQLVTGLIKGLSLLATLLKYHGRYTLQDWLLATT